MKNLNKEENSGNLDLEVKSKEKEKEEKIEKEIKEIESASKREEETADESVWDGSKALFVEDDAPSYEEKFSGIKLNFSLKEREILSCLKHCGFNIKNFIFCSLFLILLDVLFLILFINKPNIFNFVFFIIAALASLILILNIFPNFNNKIAYHKRLSHQKLDVLLYPDSINIKEGARERTIELNGSCLYEDFNDMFLIFLPDKKVFIIPKRVIEPELLPDVEAMLIAGTSLIGED